MEDLRKVWIQAGKSLVIAANDLGTSLVKTAKAGIDMAVDWAKKDNPHIRTEGTEIPCDGYEAPQAQPEQPAE